MRLLSLIVLSSLLTACFTPPIKPPVKPPLTPTQPEPISAVYKQTNWAALPNWPGEQLTNTWPSWLNSCKRLASRPVWKEICADALMLGQQDAASVKAFFESHFEPWQVTTNTGTDTGLVTGYYEPLVKGSTTPKAGSVPFYAVPDNLLILDLAKQYTDLKGKRLRGRLEGTRTVIPYWSRQEIADGKMANNAKVLAWADDAIEAFFMEVQGSGRIQLEDGTLLRLGYADQNGYPYKSIGKWLVEQGELTLDKASMQSIQAWAKANPQRLQEMLNANPSVVFFRVLTGTDGPIGALNVPLTDEASAAIDPKFVPLGSPIYLSTTRPNDSQPMNRLIQAQDTGGAIAGPIRVDYFWGFGAKAGELAGRMKQKGQVWLLWPKGMALPNSVNK
ncbi:MAG: MltA domain-containing protein [Moraxellaceae bacterium]|jgi:membrane-bound lytic murein transglycosylase A|nr:MltA domain-containing protein [Moraxellaceae bacterium]MBL0230220.1 MltA domain-containing protein [Moraxellaceae bacterium]